VLESDIPRFEKLKTNVSGDVRLTIRVPAFIEQSSPNSQLGSVGVNLDLPTAYFTEKSGVRHPKVRITIFFKTGPAYRKN
jgi:hypothetical protein